MFTLWVSVDYVLGIGFKPDFCAQMAMARPSSDVLSVRFTNRGATMQSWGSPKIPMRKWHGNWRVGFASSFRARLDSLVSGTWAKQRRRGL